MKGLWIIYSILVMLFSSCVQDEKLFRLLPAGRTGIDFNNTIAINDSINGTIFEYVYNGGGVAVGDVNNDGLKDIFFAGNQVSSSLYLNLGNFKFRDITLQSGVSTSQWCTGVSMVDINNDHLLDIYICVAGLIKGKDRNNIFFINQGLDDNGIPRFVDQASMMGLNDAGYSTMGVFLDYDKDRDLDLYLLTNAMEMSMRNALRPIRVNGEAPSTDRLYRNNGNNLFTNASAEAGILKEGYGLGVALCDINQDGWTDIYCSNDFISNDLLWINNRDGTFTDMAGIYFKHFTNSGMGMDIADFNNDGLLDVLVLDMLPYTNLRQKQMIGFKNLDKFYQSQRIGYLPQFIRNTLQLNQGKFDDGRYRFSEIGYLANIYHTDWSWAPLFADFNHDGWKDLIITNGFRKDVTNLDFIVYTMMDQSQFGSQESRLEQAISEMDRLPDVKLPNFGFENGKDLTFTDRSDEWGLDQPTFTNGTAYADLDDDGDLDLVLNNIDMPAMIFENRTDRKNRRSQIKIRFHNQVPYVDRIGTKIWLYSVDTRQFHEYSPYRGYKSTVDQDIHFGTGDISIIDSILVQWPDNSVIKFYKVSIDTTLIITKDHSVTTDRHPLIDDFLDDEATFKFRDVTRETKLILKDEETSVMDMVHIPTLIRNLSQEGPGLAVGDINNDGLDDLFVGGDINKPAHLFIQKQNNTFSSHTFPFDSALEDRGVLLFDADLDGDNDLYIVSGGSGSRNYKHYQDRLYLNDGSGNFGKAPDPLPEMVASGSCVTAADYDRDGDLDLFIGGRLKPWEYPYPPRSYLLENNNGKFRDVSYKLPVSNGEIGMVTSALWTDINNDQLIDLLVTGEWMPIHVFLNTGEEFRDATFEYGLTETDGWWNSLNGCDLDNDGDIDYLAGNNGLNSFFKASRDRPVEIHAGDFDQDGSIDPIITHYIEDESFIVHPRNILNRKIPGFQNRFETFQKYGETPFNHSFTSEELENALHLKSSIMESVVLENLNGKAFRIHILPNEVQISPVYGSLFHDFNQDLLTDIMVIGNRYADETITGYYDASYGQVLINQGDFTWKIPPPRDVNLIADGDKKALARIRMMEDDFFVFTENNGYMQILEYGPKPSGKPIKLNYLDWYALLNIDKKMTKKIEFYYGNGHLSQNSRYVFINNEIKDVRLSDYQSNTREIAR